MGSFGKNPDKSVWTINGRFLTQQMTGVQRYAHEIVGAIDQILSDNPEVAARLGFELVAPPHVIDEPILSQIEFRQTRSGAGHAWDQFVLPRYQNSGVLSLGNFGPVAARRHVVCIHDANTFIQPESYSRAFRVAYRTFLPMVGMRARKVATVSQFSADMLVKYGVGRHEKIFIAPNGHEHALRWNASRATIRLAEMSRRPYVLLLGSKAKHKNIDVVLDSAGAFDEAGIDIVVVGAASSIFSDVQTIQQSNIHYTGHVSDDDLAALYEGAVCLAFPSKVEGFGIPLLEAMARGCPVVSSNAASLVEVGGDAVLYASPEQEEAWRATIVGLAHNAELREGLAAKGRQRAKMFSWKRSAQLYLDEILKLVDTRR